jgi:hypothetical protein
MIDFDFDISQKSPPPPTRVFLGDFSDCSRYVEASRKKEYFSIGAHSQLLSNQEETDKRKHRHLFLIMFIYCSTWQPAT